MPWIAAAAVAAPIVAGVLGNAASAADKAKASSAMDAALAQINAIGAPPDLAAEIVKQHLRSAGVLNPEMEKTINAGVSQVSQIQEDPSLKNAQTKALQLLTQTSTEGLNAQDRSDLNSIRQKVQQDQEAKRQQIMQNMQARGIAGGGAELASQLAANQGAAETSSQEGDRIAAQANARALAAMSQAGTLAGGIRQQDFNVANTKANAADEFKKFDVQNQVAQQTRNVGTSNTAQAANLANAQNISNQNVGIDNAELERQAAAKQQVWADKLAQAQAAAGQEGKVSDFYSGQAAATKKGYADMGSGVSTGLLGAKKEGLF